MATELLKTIVAYLPPSSSGLGSMVLSHETGVRLPVGVLLQVH